MERSNLSEVVVLLVSFHELTITSEVLVYFILWESM